MGLRKNYRQLTASERTRFVEALHHVKFWGVVQRFADEHGSHFDHGIHRSSHFLPWHREFLFRFELELKKKHPEVTIPYWNSSVDQSPADPLWSSTFIGQFDSGWSLRRVLGSTVVSLPSPSTVEANQARATYDTFWPELESRIHNSPHSWVGGVMATTLSPGDPVFYMHHCWIDQLWARWQLSHPNAPFGAGLNDPLMGWPDRTPAHVLDHYALGYSYDTPLASFRSANYPARYLRHRNFLGELTEVSSEGDRRDATFRVVPGLADPSAVSLAATNLSNHYLRHQGFRLKLQPFSGDDLYKADATFRTVAGLSDSTKTSFQSVNHPKHYLRHRGFSLYLDTGSDSLFRSDATFQRTSSLW